MAQSGHGAQLAGFANELVSINLPVIVTYGTAAARVLQKATTTVPITHSGRALVGDMHDLDNDLVVAAAVDLVGAGIVASLAHPGGNITGFSVIDIDISAITAQQIVIDGGFSTTMWAGSLAARIISIRIAPFDD